MSIDILKEHIKENKFHSLYLFCGPEEYLKKYYFDTITNKLLSDETKALNKIVLEGKMDLSRLVDACETLPVFSDKKVVMVKNSGVFKSGKKGSEKAVKTKKTGDELSDYLQNIPEYTCLIFYEDEIDKRLKTTDIVKKNGLIVDFPFQKPPELVKWVAKVFKSYKKDISPMNASKIVDNCESGMTDILNEINKVVLYLGDRSMVTDDDIESVCSKSVKGRIFDLTDAIAEKNGIKALKLLDDMITLKEPLPKILFMITRQFRQVLEMKLLSGQGMKPGEVAAKMKITPYAASKITAQAKSFSIETLKAALEESLAMDIAIKTGKLADRAAAELLIAKFTN